MIRRHRDDPVMPNVWELPVNGDPARPVPEDDPRWSMVFPWIGTPSPDGTRVAFVQDEADGWVVKQDERRRRAWTDAGSRLQA
jgi:hypothetical protein